MTDPALIRYQKGLDGKIRQALSQCARETAASARRAAPYGEGRDGHLRDSIAYSLEQSGARYLAFVTADSPHARYVEMGTSRMAAQPYLRPAAKGAYQKYFTK